MISIIIPTIAGREESLDRCVEAYRRTTVPLMDVELVVVEDQPNWPAACNQGAERAKGDLLHFTADDLEPLDDWWPEAIAHLAVHDELPAPKVLNHSKDGVFDNHMDGADGELTEFTRIPIMTRDQYDRIGAWPEWDYCADVWLSRKARTLGIQTRMVHSYQFIHYWHPHGRLDTNENLQRSYKQLEEATRGM